MYAHNVVSSRGKSLEKITYTFSEKSKTSKNQKIKIKKSKNQKVKKSRKNQKKSCL